MGDLDVVLIDQTDPDPLARPAAYPGLGRISVGEERSRNLGHVVHGVDLYSETRGEGRNVPDQRNDERDAQTVRPVAFIGGGGGKKGGHRPHQDHHRAAGRGNHPPEFVGAIAIDHRNRSAIHEHCVDAANPTHVEEGERDHEPVRRIDERPALRTRQRVELRIRRRHRLRRAGCSRGEDNRHRVPGLYRARRIDQFIRVAIKRLGALDDQPRQFRGAAERDHRSDGGSINTRNSRREVRIHDEQARIGQPDRMLKQATTIIQVERHEDRTDIVKCKP